MSKYQRRIVFIACTVALCLSLLYWTQGSSTIPEESADTLVAPTGNVPSSLTDQEFWSMIASFSEPDGFFMFDNFLSNEAGYQRVIPELRKVVKPGGVYLGVGPEQNFTYIVALEPKIAFVVDIRRQNMLEHLLYKAFMELAADRTEFLSLLFGREQPTDLSGDPGLEELFDAYQLIEPSPEL